MTMIIQPNNSSQEKQSVGHESDNKLSQESLFPVKPKCTVTRVSSPVKPGLMFKVKTCSTGKSRNKVSKDNKRHVSRNIRSVVRTSADRQLKTPHNTQSRLPSKTSRSCMSGCVLSCCNSCSCVYRRASTKERSKFRSLVEQNKACE